MKLPKTKGHVVEIVDTSANYGEPLVICAHEGPVTVKLRGGEPEGKKRVIASSERSLSSIFVEVGFSSVEIKRGASAVFESKSQFKWLSGMFGRAPWTRWVPA